MQYNPQLGYYKATAGELISGGRAVGFNASGNLQIAMANTSGRQQAVGIVPGIILSGQVGKVFQSLDYVGTVSGQVGMCVNVGSSGSIVCGTNSLLSGYTQQIIGACSTSGAFINI